MLRPVQVRSPNWSRSVIDNYSLADCDAASDISLIPQRVKLPGGVSPLVMEREGDNK